MPLPYDAHELSGYIRAVRCGGTSACGAEGGRWQVPLLPGVRGPLEWCNGDGGWVGCRGRLASRTDLGSLVRAGQPTFCRCRGCRGELGFVAARRGRTPKKGKAHQQRQHLLCPFGVMNHDEKQP